MRNWKRKSRYARKRQRQKEFYKDTHGQGRLFQFVLESDPDHIFDSSTLSMENIWSFPNTLTFESLTVDGVNRSDLLTR